MLDKRYQTLDLIAQTRSFTKAAEKTLHHTTSSLPTNSESRNRTRLPPHHKGAQPYRNDASRPIVGRLRSSSTIGKYQSSQTSSLHNRSTTDSAWLHIIA
jgi:hypothetical protein